MKKIVSLFLFIIAAAMLPAQISVTNTTFPALGDTLRLAIDNTPGPVEISPPGGNYTWDFTGLDADLTRELVYKAASEGSAAADLPGADLYADLGAQTEGYYNVTADKFEWMAVKGPAPGGLNFSTLMKFSPPLVERRAPMNFFDINQITSSLTLPFSSDVIPDTILQNLPIVPDSIRFRINAQRLDVVDAWGTLTIPNGSFQVLREKRTEYRSTAVDVKVPIIGWVDLSQVGNIPAFGIGTDTIVTYNFMSNDAKEPIAVVTMDNQQANAVQAMYKNIGQVTGAGDLEDLKPSVSVSPNPVSGRAVFDFKNFPSGEYRLVISDAQGRLAVEKSLRISGSYSEELNLARLSAGIYFFNLFDKSGEVLSQEKLVKR